MGISDIYNKADLALIPSGFKQDKTYVVIPSDGNADLVPERAGVAKRVNKDGFLEDVQSDTSLLYYDMSEPNVPKLRLEPQSQNKLTYSQDFTNSSWIKTGVQVDSLNTFLDPEGKKNANLVTEGTTNGIHRIYRSKIESEEQVFSIFLRKQNRRYVQVSINNGLLSRGTGLDLETGEVFTAPNASQSTIIEVEKLSNGWFRVAVNNDGSSELSIHILENKSSISYVGVENYGVYIYGGQLQDKLLTSYIETSDEAVTKPVDYLMNGVNISSDRFNSQEGSFFIEARVLSDTLQIGSSKISINNDKFDGTDTFINFSFPANLTNDVRFQYRLNNTNIVTLIHKLTDRTEFCKVAFRYKQGDYSMYVNGSEVATSVNTTPLPFGDFRRMDFSQNKFKSNNPFKGEVTQLLYFKEALTDEELKILTT